VLHCRRHLCEIAMSRKEDGCSHACAHDCLGLERLACLHNSAVADRPHKLSTASHLGCKRDLHQHAD